MTSCILKMEIETALMNGLSINIDMFGYLWIRDMASAYLSHSPIITNASYMLSLLLRLCFPCYLAALFVLIIAASIVLSLSLSYVLFEHCYVCAIIATTVMILLLQYLLCLNLLLLSCFACFFCCFFYYAGTTLLLWQTMTILKSLQVPSARFYYFSFFCSFWCPQCAP